MNNTTIMSSNGAQSGGRQPRCRPITTMPSVAPRPPEAQPIWRPSTSSFKCRFHQEIRRTICWRDHQCVILVHCILRLVGVSREPRKWERQLLSEVVSAVAENCRSQLVASLSLIPHEVASNVADLLLTCRSSCLRRTAPRCAAQALKACRAGSPFQRCARFSGVSRLFQRPALVRRCRS